MLADKVSFQLSHPQWKKKPCNLVSSLEIIGENCAYVIYYFM